MDSNVSNRFVNPGDRIEQFTKIAEVQSDKAAVEITSRYDGVVKKLHYKVGDMAKVGSALVDIETDDGAPSDAPAAPTASASSPSSTPAEATSTPTNFSSDSSSEILATPAVRRMAKEKNIDLRKVAGTGKHGRILKEDLINFEASPTPAVSPITGKF
jgi:2-oxoisovalerate dehydrogenase E2 component (dihydrolipoyl transacylase)